MFLMSSIIIFQRIDDFGHKFGQHIGMILELLKELRTEIVDCLNAFALQSWSYGGDQRQRYANSNLGEY